MTGKAYSIKEMKTIVDYLIQNKAYGEIRGRKMWMDFANTQLTTRTWQSLKETFLKRILPDIHNPYYKLTIEQVNSFRQGYDIAERNKNKLEVNTVSEDSSNSNANNQNNIQTDNSTAKEDGNPAGEDITCSKVPAEARSSTETIVLENCYETPEDIQRDLESPNENNMKKPSSLPVRSLRDCITYSEPLTPMMQDILDDFQSEPESDREPQLKIVEDTNPDSEDTEKTAPPSDEISNTRDVVTEVNKSAKGVSDGTVEEVPMQVVGSDTTEKQVTQDSVINAEQVTPDINVDKDNTESGVDTTIEIGPKDIEKKEHVKKSEAPTQIETINLDDNDSDPKENASTKEKVTPEKSLTQNNSNTTTDSMLPNNPEGLDKRTSNESTKRDEIVEIFQSSEEADKAQGKRKRSISLDTAKGLAIKKKKLLNENKIMESDKVTSNGSVKTEINLKDNKDHNKKDAKHEARTTQQTTKPKKQDVAKLDNLDKPSTSKAIDDNSIAVDTANTPHIENPCLKNVSLFDEQFAITKYTTSEFSEAEETVPKPANEQKENVNKVIDDVVMLKSHSDSDSNAKSPPRRTSHDAVSAKKQRDRALANVFGFSSGAVTSQRKLRLNRHKKTGRNSSHNNHGSGSSEWTSETDSDTYVSPPRGRKNRQTRKYLKPQSARILSLEEEGGLFVMYGKKIYPLVKDGKIVKNYLSYMPESDSEEEKSYWKLKYEEEKRKANELKRLLQAKESRTRDTVSPLLQPKQLRNSTTTRKSKQPSPENTEICIPGRDEKIEEVPQEKIKIKFTKNNEEVHLEGHWPQIHPVLAQVVEIFHKESDNVVRVTRSNLSLSVQENQKVSGSRESTPIVITPVDPEVHERVNELEKEILKEIEARDQEEQSTQNGGDGHVTKRKIGRPRKSSTSSAQSPPKRAKRSTNAKTSESAIEIGKTDNAVGAAPVPVNKVAENKVTDNASSMPAAESENKTTTNKISTRRSGAGRKVLNETANTNETKTIQTRRSKQTLNKSTVEADDDDVRYMFPEKTKRHATKASNSKTKEQKPQRSIKKIAKIFSSPDNVSLNSLDSTQGYQDSDISPMRTELRKKKFINRTSLTLKRHHHKNTKQTLADCDSNDSTNSSTSAPFKIPQNSTLNAEAYKSESYELLMPGRKPFVRLQRIDETAPFDTNNHYETVANNQLVPGPINSDVASSSNVSLPPSPELSIVENITASKSILSIGELPTLNETDCSEINDLEFCKKYLMSGVDVSVPLMQQACAVTLENNKDANENDMTESLLNKIGTFNIGAQTPVSEALNQKLMDLLLESGKKVEDKQKQSMMDVDNSNVANKTKAGNKKRCSTPRKRKASKKSSAPKVAKVEEEHVEACSFGGRKSCPPLIENCLHDDNALHEQIANLSVNGEPPEKLKVKRKKDIIKVKILRPQNKTSNNSSSAKTSKISIGTDSGINDTVSDMFLPINESVDFIHNHSETCLHANECVGDSLELVEKQASLISLSSNFSDSNEWLSQLENRDPAIAVECFSNNAQDAKNFFRDAKAISKESSDTVYYSPVGTELSNNSLITEDMSDDIPSAPAASHQSKWYLLSDDETANTNSAPNDVVNIMSFGANLKQIFPVTCAVPDLSTITEMSKDDDNSRKPTMETDGDTVDDVIMYSRTISNK